MRSISKYALSLLSLVPHLVAGADCTAPNQELFEQYAVDMMWTIRQEYCINHWSADMKLYIDHSWCNQKTHNCWKGWWYGRGHATQQSCWDVTEQIIRQCMKKDGATSWNGGRYAYGNEYQEGWFYGTAGNERTTLATTGEESHYHTLLNGTIVWVDKVAVLEKDDEAANGYRVVQLTK